MLEKLDFAGNEVMILLVTIIGLLAYNWRRFRLFGFSFSQ